MYRRMIIKISAIITALVALNVSLVLFGYGMVLPNWALYVSLVASIIVLLASAVGIVMHGGHGCMCGENKVCNSKGGCDCGKLNCNCKC